MKKLIFLIIIILSALGFQLSAVIQAAELKPVKPGQLAPLFMLRDFEGSYVSLKNFCDVDDTKTPPALKKQRAVVILNFFSTICFPCMEEMPALQRIYEKYKDKGLKMFLISIDGKPEEVLPQFIKDYGVEVPILLDMYQKTLQKYGFESVPHTILIDKNRKILSVSKEDKEIDKKLDEKLSQLLK
ncbi:hypothetical protein COY52_02240 [Candidatus Desantisbacteria bacterium CG_4_10_14_0_8_um_filter_48_22]|uniref:Thioredoxin domain-containing protein n=1 Tax=Candidatus Desantisbacteria bacterium CG_4_10_14_0_8_um_filter_48_22 TaxID=1974543 RepID=A0A2M7SEF1_9BACT|nr:MAG: hypothetical protein AUJ67_01725 [Candidatus Desantisbacteria bacterium CG1_02_49_89]PIV56559.1 MAG: hypothetical protein COS16_03570 [Candidatus Desantisbacteria bacterium CG02_land_8_20_14_3_00_49_13]PIZ17902.1 MAG: hypothetical protein COY52_02240 [Candidatus Desantisbacteria bacterium CG_4_10_14_0_8_um_filter_48_22]